MFGNSVVGMRLRIGMAVAVLGLVGAASGWAQGPGGEQDGMPGMGPHRPPMERALGPGSGMHGEHSRWWNDAKAIEKFKLTDAQRKSMDDIFQQNRVTLVDLHAELEKQEIAMEPLMKADQPDEGKILQQIDRVAQARAELEKANARMLLGIRRQLTPDQWKQMEADRAARHAAHTGPEGEGRWRRGAAGQGGPGQGGPGQGGPDSNSGPGGGTPAPGGPESE